ncbi:MAG: hypothetical protein IKJ14_04205 [Clostridia bacterium]|nr:hypothetical protein [Clostridia bacterium]
MNNNKYYEFNIQPTNEKRDLFFMGFFKIFKIISIILAVFFAVIAFFLWNFGWIVAGFFLLSAFIFNYLQGKFYSFYDLVFVDGDITVVKVINNKKRRVLKKFSVKSIVKIGFAGGEAYELNVNKKQVKKLYLTSTVTDQDVCMIVEDMQKYMIIMPFDDRFLSCIMRFTGSIKFEKEFLNGIN